MKFTLSIPEPATMRAGKETYVELPGATELHRIHVAKFGSTQFNDTAFGDARFSPIRAAAGDLIPTIYGAQSFEAAACEIILRCPDVPLASSSSSMPPLQIVFPIDHRDRCHSVVQTTITLKLLDLSVSGQRRIGVNHNALLAGPQSSYPATRAWAERIHAACPSVHGIHYGSVQYGPHFALVLFGDRIPAGALEPVSSRRVADAACHDAIQALGRTLSIDYEDV